jgi:dethiobiotin synthetase
LYRSFLVTGTDTGIGKTTVACAIAAGLGARGLRIGVSKPVETGCEKGVPADAVRLRYFADSREPLDAICPYRFRAPLAPFVAARREGRNVDLDLLEESIDGCRSRHDVTLVEGAGGLLVPLTECETFADLAARCALPLLVVVGNRLGALNHARLTIDWARRSGLEVAGYVVNSLSGGSDEAVESNFESLRELLGPALGELPWLGPLECSEADRRRLAEVASERLDLGALSA